MEKTIREIIADYQNEILKGNLQPQRAAEILVSLSALLGNINDEITKRDIEYNITLQNCYADEETANRAKIKAETTPQYEAKRKARDTKDLTIEMIRGIKFFLKAKEEEYQTSRYQ